MLAGQGLLDLTSRDLLSPVGEGALGAAVTSAFQRERRPSPGLSSWKVGLLEDIEIAPDRTDGAVELPRGIIDGEARRVVDQLEELPLPSELVPARHVGKYDTQTTSPSVSMCPY